MPQSAPLPWILSSALLLGAAGSGCSDEEGPVDCGPTPTLANATFVEIVRSGSNQLAYYACDPGTQNPATRDGTLTSVCGSTLNHTWSTTQSCKPTTWIDPTTDLEWQSLYTEVRTRHEDASGICSMLSLEGGGYRLPTAYELWTLVRYTADDAFTPSTLDGRGEYWTANETNSGNGIYVDFDSGRFYNVPDGTVNVRCVRGEALPEPSFTTNADGTATDASTGLTWQRSPGDSTRLGYSAAVAHCAALAGGGFRIPSMQEFATLLASDDFSLDLDVFSDIPLDQTWTSDTNRNGDGYTIDVLSKIIDTDARTFAWHVWCVKGP